MEGAVLCPATNALLVLWHVVAGGAGVPPRRHRLGG